MTDRERLLQGLRLCADGRPCYKDKFRDCPYTPIGQMPDYNCAAAMARDALAVLQEQHMGAWIYDRPGHYRCSACGAQWGQSARLMTYCPGCGRRMRYAAD